MQSNQPQIWSLRQLLQVGGGRSLLATSLGVASGVTLMGSGWLDHFPNAVGMLLAMGVGWFITFSFMPWRQIQATMDERAEVRRITDVLCQLEHGDRRPLIKLTSDGDDEIATLSRAIHEALTHAASQRLEVGRLKRTMDQTIKNQTSRATGRLQREAATDSLTGLGNRRALTEKLQKLAEAGLRSGRPLTALVFDVDCFKLINDELGHLVGDECLAFLGGVLRSGLRGGDRAYRIGGDEFLVLMPAQDSQIGGTVAERLVSLFRQMPWSHEQLERPTLSVGIATVVGEELTDPDELVRRADKAMYDAKQEGRNRVCRYSSPRAA